MNPQTQHAQACEHALCVRKSHTVANAVHKGRAGVVVEAGQEVKHPRTVQRVVVWTQPERGVYARSHAQNKLNVHGRLKTRRRVVVRAQDVDGCRSWQAIPAHTITGKTDLARRADQKLAQHGARTMHETSRGHRD